jgi:hypothetical protein
LDFNPKWGGGSNDPSCTSCNGPITADQPSVRIDFANDPHGHRGLSGLYHEECGKPLRALANAFNMTWFSRF